jgi:hypothetical protein
MRCHFRTLLGSPARALKRGEVSVDGDQLTCSRLRVLHDTTQRAPYSASALKLAD